MFNVEARRRLGANWTIDLELRIIADADRDSRLQSLARDDHARLVIARHF